MLENEPEFLAIFRDEANELLDAMVAVLLACERGVADVRQSIDLLFRHAHTLKGSAGILGLDDIRELAHAVEDVLEEPRLSGVLSSEIIEPLLRAVDVLRAYVEGNPEGKDDLLDELSLRRSALVHREPSATGFAGMPIKKIRAKMTVVDQAFKRLICCRDHTHINGYWRVAADRFEPLFF